MTYPVHFLQYPTDYDRSRNGQLHDSEMTMVDFPRWGPLPMHHLAARAWAAFAHDCELATGVVLTCTSPADVYRDLPTQIAALNQRAVVVDYATYVAADPKRRRAWAGKWWVFKPGVAGVATPGNSDHGWGGAVDAAVYVPPILFIKRKPAALFLSKAWSWCLAHAAEYGFSWASQAEPWHLQYFAGDQLPAVVLRFEASTPPPTPLQPLPIPEDHDMAQYWQADDGDIAIFAVTGTIATWVEDGAQMAQLVYARRVESPSVVKTPRGNFGMLTLVGPPPIYPPGFAGGKTTAAHFKRAA